MESIGVKLKAAEATEPTAENRRDERRRPPKRMKNKDRRSREYLTPSEVQKLMNAARSGKGEAGGATRHAHRDATIIMLMFRHGLRVSEACALRWDQIDLTSAVIHVNRAKGSVPSTHPLRGPELRALRQLKREYPESTVYVFPSERGGPLTDFAVRKMIQRAGLLAKLGDVHPHMLRHATGYYLAEQGADTRAIAAYLGHRNLMNTMRYTETSPHRFKSFFKD